MTHSKSETLKGPGVPGHYIPYEVEDGPLCRHTMPTRRVICDNFAHFKFIGEDGRDYVRLLEKTAVTWRLENCDKVDKYLKTSPVHWLNFNVSL